MLMPFYLCAQSGPMKLTRATDISAIRALRAQSNRAIQARDLAAFGQTMLPDIEVTRGSGPHVSGRDSVLASVSVQFKDPDFLGYVRDSDSIQVSTATSLAAEHGHWTGRFQRPDGIQTLTGVYLAMWRKTDAGWKIRSELFVNLGCTGSAACGK
ncbi:nuclear transport factor 2 family protein [Spirosoma aureum]|uniref:Nuclear transport factor 2 family protein n=2 Tax=Spirosoma aureum TaxID=2692134 RepID=A0A6G9AZQ1_9BACT|nr:nuclear transport factor 2 family protein [Spirosoma aureum]